MTDWLTPVDDREMRPYPPDGAKPSENPPSFRWRKMESGDVYEVFIKLEDGPLVRRLSSTNILALDRPLPPGTHSWRVRRWGAYADADNWSNERRFEIESRTPVRQVMSPAGAFRIAASRGRPRLLPPDPQRSLMIADAYIGWKRPYFDAVLDQLQTGNTEFPETDGPLSRLGAAQLSQEQLVQLRRNIRASVNRVMRQTYQGLLVWVVTRNLREGDQGLAEARAAANWLTSLDPLGITSDEVADLLNLRIAIALATAYDVMYDALDVIERTSMLAAIENRVQQTFDKFVVDESRALAAYPYNSHGFRHALGILAISTIMAGETPRAQSWFNATYPVFSGFGNPWGGDDGGYSNGINYATWDMLNNLQYWDTIRNVTGADYFSSGWARQAGNFLQYIIPPGSPTSGFGDGAEDFKPLLWTETIRMLFERTRLPQTGHLYAAWRDLLVRNDAELPELEAEFASWTFLLGAGAPPAAIDRSTATIEGLPDSAIFPSIGWVAMHSDLADPDRFSIYFKSSPYGSFNHSHADQNSFIINGRQQPLAIDSGYYDTFRSRHHLAWTTQTVAHNAITYDGGKGQPWDDLSAQGNLARFVSCPGYDAVTGNATQAYRGELQEARRTLLYLRPGTLLVHDRLRSAVPRRFEWNIHADHKMKPWEGNGIRLEKSRASVCIRPLYGPESAFSQTDAFPIDPNRELQPDWQKQWHGQFRTREMHDDMEWLFLVSFDCRATANSEPERLPSGALTLMVGTERVTIGTDGANVRGQAPEACRIPLQSRPFVADAAKVSEEPEQDSDDDEPPQIPQLRLRFSR